MQKPKIISVEHFYWGCPAMLLPMFLLVIDLIYHEWISTIHPEYFYWGCSRGGSSNIFMDYWFFFTLFEYQPFMKYIIPKNKSLHDFLWLLFSCRIWTQSDSFFLFTSKSKLVAPYFSMIIELFSLKWLPSKINFLVVANHIFFCYWKQL